jgi:hypothetical protein
MQADRQTDRQTDRQIETSQARKRRREENRTEYVLGQALIAIFLPLQGQEEQTSALLPTADQFCLARFPRIMIQCVLVTHTVSHVDEREVNSLLLRLTADLLVPVR